MIYAALGSIVFRKQANQKDKVTKFYFVCVGLRIRSLISN